MDLRKSLAVSILALGLTTIGVSLAQNPPAQSVNAGRHSNLAAAQRLTDQANREPKAYAQATKKNHN